MSPAPMPGITRDEYCARLERVREAMSAEGLDALIAYANKTHPGHVRYLTGYEPRLGIHDSAACVVTSHSCVLLTNASFDRPHTLTWLGAAVVTGDYAADIAPILPGRARSVGIAGFRALPTPIYLGLRERFPRADLRDASELMLT